MIYEAEEIAEILKDHGVKFLRCGNMFFIDTYLDGNYKEEVHVKSLNSTERIRNFLGY